VTTTVPADGAVDPAARKLIWVLVPGAVVPAPDRTTIVKLDLWDLGRGLRVSVATSQRMALATLGRFPHVSVTGTQRQTPAGGGCSDTGNWPGLEALGDKRKWVRSPGTPAADQSATAMIDEFPLPLVDRQFIR